VKRLISMLALAAGAAAIVAMALAGGASAHSPYDSSTPAPGANLTTAPTSVVINFTDNIQKTFGSYGVTVVMDGGGSVTNGAATVSGDKQLTQPLLSGLTVGRYVVNWNNTAADDGDPLSGAFSFYINTQPTAANLAADQQLAAVEANQLATATAQANDQATQTAQAGAPAPVATAPVATAPAASTPVARPSAAAPSSALPPTGTGTGRPGGAFESNTSATFVSIVVLALVGTMIVAGGALARRRG
jgi:methionine-rich copper-binding protein CopC